jgi:hypothetical protein
MRARALLLLALLSPASATAATTVSGEVVIVEGDDRVVATDGHNLGLVDTSFPLLARRVIEAVGDHFQTLTLWLTFNDAASGNAVAYELPVRNEVDGLGFPVFDDSAAFGSQGTLRAMLNMKDLAMIGGSSYQSWATALSIWGQESSHRWLVYLRFRDPRTGYPSDALLGRDCAHYSRYVDTQASVHDGYAWTDNRDGTFTWTASSKRYGDLDLYGMGLMAADEVPPFFLIDDIPGYSYPGSCLEYSSRVRPSARTIIGQRVDVTIDDVIAANGPRRFAGNERQDYWREAEVIVTSPGEKATDPRVVQLAARLNQVRLFWERWNREASRNRLTVCTQVTADCGDPRSAVSDLSFEQSSVAPEWGPVPIGVEVTNDGSRTTPAVTAIVEVSPPAGPPRQGSRAVGALAVGASRTVAVPVDLHGLACGTQLAVTASTQSDFHHARRQGSFVLGYERKLQDGFENDSGWTINPDGDDSVEGAAWQRGQPQVTNLLGQVVQPGTAHGGQNAWVTGLLAEKTGERATLTRAGTSTLQSPLYSTAGLNAPVLGYWVSFAGVRGAGQALIPSPRSLLVVQARAVGGADWIAVDSLGAQISAPDWIHRTAPLPPEVASAAQFQLRFVAVDDNDAQGGVEAAIDDLELTSRLPSCDLPPPEGGCSVAGRGRGGAILLLGVLVGLVRRRHARALQRPVQGPAIDAQALGGLLLVAPALREHEGDVALLQLGQGGAVVDDPARRGRGRPEHL